ncbi:MAG: tRNA pseudouridine(38-40) synthase TruA [Pseudomonadota bacterium]
MPRYKLTIEFDGTPFVGWQRQDNGPSVQGALEAAAKRFCGEATPVHGAGRTDAGVHARAMVAHIDFERAHSVDVIRDALNHHLRPNPVAVLSAEPVDDDFHARFSCIQRAYEYRYIDRRPPLTLEANRAWRTPRPLNVDAMHDAAQLLVGKHDFSTFRAAACQADTPIKTLNEISVARVDDMVFLRCAARSFLHHQVRSFAGCLQEVGSERWRAEDLKAALKARSRKACAVVAPAHGLYFLRADYAHADGLR